MKTRRGAMRGHALATLILAVTTAASSVHAAPDVADPQQTAATADEAGLTSTTAKFNAYVAYMNRTLRVVDSLARYRSWVDMRRGPTGHEHIVYGLYAPYDTTDERAAAQQAMAAPPALPELDDAMRTYIGANDKVAPTLTKADGYYSRGDYKLDRMAEGRTLHAAIAADGDAFLAAREKLDAVLRVQKLALDRIRLATIEKKDGRKARWHVANVMMRGKIALDALTDGDKGRVDLAAFDSAMVGFGDAVKSMDEYAAAHPRALGAFSSFPDDLLSRMREIGSRLTRTNGDLRRAAGLDMTWVQSTWNTMVTTADLPIALQEQ